MFIRTGYDRMDGTFATNDAVTKIDLGIWYKDHPNHYSRAHKLSKKMCNRSSRTIIAYFSPNIQTGGLTRLLYKKRILQRPYRMMKQQLFHIPSSWAAKASMTEFPSKMRVYLGLYLERNQ
jgi:hypothetical protein